MDANDIERRLDALAARHWSSAEEVNRLTLGSGDAEVTLYGSPAAMAALVDTLTAAGDALHDARVDAATLRTRVEQLERARDMAEERAHAARAASHAATGHASAADTTRSRAATPSTRAATAGASHAGDRGDAASHGAH